MVSTANHPTNARLNWARSWLAKPRAHYVGGEFLSGKTERRFSVTNPADGTQLCDIPVADDETLDRVTKIATAAQKKWSKTTRREKQRVLVAIGQLIRDHADELATLEALCNGKLFREAREDDIPESADVFDYYAGWVDKVYSDVVPTDDGTFNYTRREPAGVCALIVPWNFPLLMACWKIAPALALGNAVIVKPSEYTSLSVLRLCELINEKMKLEPGLFNVVCGDGTTGNKLVRHAGIHKVAFTGSTAIGREIVKGSAESNLKTVTLELGGKSPNILFADTSNPEQAIERQFNALFSHKGEKCSEPTLFIVHETLYDRALDQLAAMSGRTVLGDPFAPESTQGAQANRSQFEKIMRYIDYGKTDGAKLVAGGKAPEIQGGWYVQPTIFADVTTEMRIATDEIFGPVLSVFKFREDEEAIAIANHSPYGLAAGFYTQNVTRAHRVAEQLDAGMVFINHYGMYDFASPFGGFKQSGWGKEMAKHSIDAYTKTKSVWIKL